MPPTAVATLKDELGLTVYNGPGLTLRDFIINSSPYKTTNLELLDPRCAWRWSTRSTGDEIVADGVARVREAGIHDRAPGDRRLARPADPAAAVRHRQGERDPGRGRVHARARRDPRRERSPDELHGAVRGGRARRGRRARSGSSRTGSSRSASSSPSGRWTTTPSTPRSWATTTRTTSSTWRCGTGIPLIDPDFILSVMTCAQFGDWSDTGYCNKTYDTLYAQQGLAVDQSKRVTDRLRRCSRSIVQRPALHRPRATTIDQRLVQRLDRVRRVRRSGCSTTCRRRASRRSTRPSRSERGGDECTAPTTSSSDSRSR